MGVINEDILKKQLSSSDISPVYIIYGDDSFLKKTYVDRISKKIADKNDIFNYQKFDSDCNLQEVYDAVVQFPMMAEKKCIILCDYNFEQASKSDFEMLCKIIEETSNTNVLIMWFDFIDIQPKKNSKFIKITKTAEKSGGYSVLLNHKRVPELTKLISDGAVKRGHRLDSSVARYMIETCGEDLNVLINELEKICNYSTTQSISKNDIDYICSKTTEASIYNLSGQILSCNIQNAIKTLDDLFYSHIEPMIILYTVSSAFVDCYRVYAGKKAGISNVDIASFFGYRGKEFLLDRATSNLNKLNFIKLSLCLQELVETDNKFKSNNSNARIVLEQMIIRLVYILEKGEVLDKTGTTDNS